MQGISTRITSSGLPVLRLHYSADPNKRINTPQGNAWLAEALQGYPGGVKNPRWRKEMEIEYNALGGQKVIPDWEDWLTKGSIVRAVNPTGWKFYATYDHGWRNPACYLIHAISPQGVCATLWEFYGAEVSVPNISKIIKGQGAAGYAGNPYHEQETIKIADPSIWAENQADPEYRSIGDAFVKQKVIFDKGERGGDTTVISWLLGDLWCDPANPRYTIAPNCINLIKEIGLQRYKDYTPRMLETHDNYESLVDKNNHAWDAMKMFFNRFYLTHLQRTEKKPLRQESGSFSWWRKQTTYQRGETTPRSFRVKQAIGS